MTIPDSVTSIGGGVFYGCSGLTSPVYNKHIFAKLPDSYSGIYEIPNGIKTIEHLAFLNTDNLTSVHIPNSVINIKDGAFGSNDNFPIIDNIRYSDISNHFCLVEVVDKTLSQYNIQEGTKWIEAGTEIPTIGTTHCGFLNCSNLTSIAIPNSIIGIGAGAFSGCASLTSVYISDLSLWCNILFSTSSANPLSKAHKLYVNNELITNLIIPNNVTSIGNYAFVSCDITSITIPNSVTSIGKGTFSSCTNLTSLTIPNSVISIGESAFSNCSGISSITMPNNIQIMTNAFDHYSGLVIMPVLKNIYVNSIFEKTQTGGSTSGIVYSLKIESVAQGTFDGDYNCTDLLTKGSNKVNQTYNIYTDDQTVYNQMKTLHDSNEYTIINLYHLDGTPWE